MEPLDHKYPSNSNQDIWPVHLYVDNNYYNTGTLLCKQKTGILNMRLYTMLTALFLPTCTVCVVSVFLVHPSPHPVCHNRQVDQFGVFGMGPAHGTLRKHILSNMPMHTRTFSTHLIMHWLLNMVCYYWKVYMMMT